MGHNFLKGAFHFHAPIGAFVILKLTHSYINVEAWLSPLIVFTSFIIHISFSINVNEGEREGRNIESSVDNI